MITLEILPSKFNLKARIKQYVDFSHEQYKNFKTFWC